MYTWNIFNLNYWQINKTKEIKELSFGLLWHDPKFTERKTTAVVFFILQKLDSFECLASICIPEWLSRRRLTHTQTTYFCDIAACSLSKFLIKIQLKNHIITSTAPLYNLLHSAWPLCWCERWWSMWVKHKAYFINNNILASRYITNMKTFGFVPNERGRHQFHLKLIRFWLYIYIA